MKQLKIIGIQVTDRIKEAGRTQHILTKYADNIRTRLGFHEVNEAVCSRAGLIILELCGDETKQLDFISELESIGGLNIQHMDFHL
ncbi:MAG TPA: hypothetical protein VHO72_14670 [Bacteroidales bacterium]|nr:hypothetical protein [Bacteroidales bacterium]